MIPRTLAPMLPRKNGVPSQRYVGSRRCLRHPTLGNRAYETVQRQCHGEKVGREEGLLMAMFSSTKRQPVALISKRSVDRTPRPYSVAWISRRLAEPATRVRIAVGPLFSVPCERFVSNSPFMARPLMLLRMTIEWTLGIDGHRVPRDSHEP